MGGVVVKYNWSLVRDIKVKFGTKFEGMNVLQRIPLNRLRKKHKIEWNGSV